MWALVVTPCLYNSMVLGVVLTMLRVVKVQWFKKYIKKDIYSLCNLNEFVTKKVFMKCFIRAHSTLNLGNYLNFSKKRLYL